MGFTGSFSNWLKVRRKALDLTQIELADQVGCAVVTIRKFERNVARPSKQIAERLGDALVLSTDERTPFIVFARSITEETPAPSGDHQFPDSRTHLPKFATPFIGRVDEIRELAGLLRDPYCRLLTLSGPGGIGKTRIAIQVAAEKESDFPEGIYFISLAPLNVPDQIIPAIANTMGLLLRNGESSKQQLISDLREKRCLLILDNFEHLLEGVSLVTDLLDGATASKLLITSREVLNLQEEWVRQIKGMPLPGEDVSENIEGYGAIQLFVDRAVRARGDFYLRNEQVQVIRIGRLVEGTPLAIELAATWLRTMTCEQIADAIQRDVD